MNQASKTTRTVLKKTIVKIFGIFRYLQDSTTSPEPILVFYVYVKMARNFTARPYDVLHLRYVHVIVMPNNETYNVDLLCRTVFSTLRANRVVSSSVWTKPSKVRRVSSFIFYRHNSNVFFFLFQCCVGSA